MGEATSERTEKLRQAMVRNVPRPLDDARSTDGLLEDVAKEVEVSLHTAAIELFDLLQWGTLKLTADGRVTRGPEGAPSQHASASRPQTPGRYDRPQLESRGSAEKRTEGRIDRDRIIQSWAFRRLEGVTQIVTPDHSGHLMHSRLIHSIKVGQVARRIADRLVTTLDEDTIRSYGGLDPDVVEAAGLAHDIGHPPFGHAGEKELDRLARKMGLRDGFEGNAQTFRVLNRLEFRFSHWHGMNLTNATQAAVLKYPWVRPKSDESPRWEKFNVYDSDQEFFRQARSGVGLRKRVQTLEASVMDIADDITYALHDLEDYYTAGLFRRNQIAAILGDYSVQRREKGSRPTTSDEYDVIERHAKKLSETPGVRFDQKKYEDAVDKVRSLVRFSMYRHFDGSRASFSLIRTAFASRIDSYVREVHVERTSSGPVARLGADHWYEIEVLKELNRKFVLDRAELALVQHGQIKLLRDTVKRLEKWCKRDSNLDRRMPLTLREFIADAKDDTSPVARGIVDYVASLTDAQLVSLAQALSGAAPPSTVFV